MKKALIFTGFACLICGYVWFNYAICVFEPNISPSHIKKRIIKTQIKAPGTGFSFTVTDVFYTNENIIVICTAWESQKTHKWRAIQKTLSIVANLPDLPTQYYLITSCDFSIKDQAAQSRITSVFSITALLRAAKRVPFKFKVSSPKKERTSS